MLLLSDDKITKAKLVQLIQYTYMMFLMILLKEFKGKKIMIMIHSDDEFYEKTQLVALKILGYVKPTMSISTMGPNLRIDKLLDYMNISYAHLLNRIRDAYNEKPELTEKNRAIAAGTQNTLYHPAVLCNTDKKVAKLIQDYGGPENLISRCVKHNNYTYVQYKIFSLNIDVFKKIDPDQNYLEYPLFVCPKTFCQYFKYNPNFISLDYYFKNYTITIEKCIDIGTQCLNALKLLHKYGYSHGDLHFNNWLLDTKTLKVKLTDLDTVGKRDEAHDDLTSLIKQFQYYFNKNDYKIIAEQLKKIAQI